METTRVVSVITGRAVCGGRLLSGRASRHASLRRASQRVSLRRTSRPASLRRPGIGEQGPYSWMRPFPPAIRLSECGPGRHEIIVGDGAREGDCGGC